MSPVRVAVVPHTHWDREWYATFESFRGRLVDLLDELLPLVEGDPGYAHFLLDGQLAVVDDYVAIRPDAADRLRHLVGAGRLAVGPWYTLPDEFCVSGETLVRDLQLGLERATRLGGAMAVGYLPDMFGHVGQMPQLLRLAGFDRAVVWRGVPAAIDRTAFWWSAPDGSSLLTEYLWTGYGNGSSVPDDAKALVARLRLMIAELGDRRHGDLLFMNGTDHERPQPWLGRVVAEANELADDLEIRITSLADALATDALATDADHADLPRWTGELRSGARANLLMGVLSNRVDIKQAAAAAERALELVAEPLSALWQTPGDWPGNLLDDAWLEVIRNAAHDSSCACSIDAVCDAVLTRYRGARHTAEAVTERAVRAIAARLDEPGTVIINPSQRARGGLLELELPGGGPAGDAQVIEDRPAVIEDRILDVPGAMTWLAAWRSQQIGTSTYVLRAEVTEDDQIVSLTLHADRRLSTNLLVSEIRADVERRLTPGARLHLRIVQPPRRRVLCRVDDVPAFGWARWVPAPLAVPPVTGSVSGLSNSLVDVRIDASSATFALADVEGLGRLVESGDHGDTYNYCPPDEDSVVASPVHVDVTLLESGPVRGRVELRATYEWPESVDHHQRVGRIATTVTTIVEVRAGERFVRVSHACDNRSRDHRVRAVFPLDQPATISRAECAFGIVTRGLHAEGGPTEQALATYPSRRFVSAGSLTVVHDGLLEYELTTRHGESLAPLAVSAEALCLTLVRSTGMLSRVDLPMRPLPAGPPIPVAGAQIQGQVHAAYAVCLDPTIHPYALADDVLLPLLTARAPGGGPSVQLEATGLVIEGAEVSAVRRERGALTVRIHNPQPAPTEVSVAGRAGWVIDLQGRPIRPFEGTLGLGPWEIATLQVTD